MIKDGECTICVNLAHTYGRGISGRWGFPLDYPAPFSIIVLKENVKCILKMGWGMSLNGFTQRMGKCWGCQVGLPESLLGRGFS